jgi:hypothetical protein
MQPWSRIFHIIHYPLSVIHYPESVLDIPDPTNDDGAVEPAGIRSMTRRASS